MFLGRFMKRGAACNVHGNKHQMHFTHMHQCTYCVRGRIQDGTNLVDKARRQVHSKLRPDARAESIGVDYKKPPVLRTLFAFIVYTLSE